MYPRMRTNLSSLLQGQVIVLRGDLYSDSGYARATRAFSKIFAQLGLHIFGVSLHEHEHRRLNDFLFPVVRDDDVLSIAFRGAVILNICLPNEFLHVRDAYNIGYFFWETDKLPLNKAWKAHLSLMDRLWAPSVWQSLFLQGLTGDADVPVIYWPQNETERPQADASSVRDLHAHTAMSMQQLDNYLMRVTPPEIREIEKYVEEQAFASGDGHRFDPDRSALLSSVLDSPGDVYLAVQTDAARKGLPLLLTAWLLFKRRPEAATAKLVIKLSSLDVTADMYRTHFHSSLAVQRAVGRIGGDTAAGIYFVYDRLSDGQLHALLDASDALVSASLGEGFGGPLAEAFLLGIPVIGPAHTSCVDILGERYEFTVKSEGHRFKLWNNIDIYSPSSTWNVIDDAAFVACLSKFAKTSTGDRDAICLEAKRRLLQKVSIAAVSAAIFNELLALTEAFKSIRVDKPRSKSAYT